MCIKKTTDDFFKGYVSPLLPTSWSVIVSLILVLWRKTSDLAEGSVRGVPLRRRGILLFGKRKALEHSTGSAGGSSSQAGKGGGREQLMPSRRGSRARGWFWNYVWLSVCTYLFQLSFRWWSFCVLGIKMDFIYIISYVYLVAIL